MSSTFLIYLEMVVAFFYEMKMSCRKIHRKNETTNLESNFTFDQAFNYFLSAKKQTVPDKKQ